jgi:uncharacterized membrane protein
MIPFLALAIGVVAGLRAMAAPAVVSWAAYLGGLEVKGTWAAFMGHPAAAWVLGLLALSELVTDQLPQTPARIVPVQFSARVINGTFSGAVLGAAQGRTLWGAILGAVGAVLGTLVGYRFRTDLTRANHGHDRPVALLEDAIAILGAIWIVRSIP